MLASRASTAVRHSSRIARTFTTVVDTAGVKVAAVDNGQPTSAVTFLVKAGSRFESKPGVAHALKNFAYKSTEKRSALVTVREAELYGGVLSSSLSREHLALTAEFLRGDAEYFVDVLASFIASARYTRHEFTEYVLPVVEAESTAASADPATKALEVAHTLAFRSGLGSSLFASSHPSFTSEDIKTFAASAFSSGNIAVLGTGIDQATLSKLVEKSLGKLGSTEPAAAAPSSKYYGGETRLESTDGPQTVFIGFGTSGAPSADLAALAAHISPEPAVKWSQGTSSLAAAIPAGTSVKSVYLPYSDATLFGLLIQGKTGADVKEAGKAAVAALKAGVKDAAEVKKAVAKAKFNVASSFETSEGLVALLGSKVLAGSDASIESALSSFDKVNASSISAAASSLVKGKPTFVAIGDVKSLPYSDELGL